VYSYISCYSNVPLENAKIVEFSEARLSDWNHVSTELSYLPPMEADIRVVSSDHQITYNILLLATTTSNNRYNAALITKNKDVEKGFILKRGQLSDWLIENF
jgi:hypothetical protein